MRYFLIVCTLALMLGCSNETQVQSVDTTTQSDDIKLDGKKRIETH